MLNREIRARAKARREIGVGTAEWLMAVEAVIAAENAQTDGMTEDQMQAHYVAQRASGYVDPTLRRYYRPA